jgi:tetratricopeptide (TPR) repeat protein
MNNWLFICLCYFGSVLPSVAQQDRYTPRYSSTLHAVLKMEEVRMGRSDLINRYDSIFRFVDHLIDRAESECSYSAVDNSNSTARHLLKIIHELLLDEGFIFNRSKGSFYESLTPISPDSPEIPKYLANLRPAERRAAAKRKPIAYFLADCDISVLLYMALGETLQLPVTAIWLPKHMILRWELPDKSSLLVETQSGRISQSEDLYREKYRISLAEEITYEYFKPLGSTELKGLYSMLFGIDKWLYPACSDNLRGQFLDQALALRPGFPFLQVMCINHWLVTGDTVRYEKASRLAASLLEITPQHPYYQLVYAYASIKTGKAGEMVQQLETELQQDETNAAMMDMLAYAYLKTGQTEKACEHFAKAKALGVKEHTDKEILEFLEKSCN